MNNLSKREREVLAVIALGFTSKEAARHFNINSRTIEKHLSCARAKLSAKNTVHAIIIAYVTEQIDIPL